jgi:hypothetical protein
MAIFRYALEIIAIAIIISIAVYFGADRASFAAGMLAGGLIVGWVVK